MGSNMIFLTSTVTPRSIKCSSGADERRKEYIQAIYFYLNHTNCKVLIVDNSGYDYSKDINHERFECLHYIGDESDEAFGKGYCETKILMYGFDHSNFIQTSEQIVKITGRHIIKNVNKLMAQAHNVNCVYADSDLRLKYPHSYIFIAPKAFFRNHLFPYISFMNDSNNMHFEHVFGKSILEYLNNKGKFEEFWLPIYIIGHPGGAKVNYAKPSIIRYVIIFTKYLFFKLRRCSIKQYNDEK